MNKFLLFAGLRYYPLGGGEDLQGGYNSLEKAIQAHNSIKYDQYDDGGWANILNTETLKIEKTFQSGVWRDGAYSIMHI